MLGVARLQQRISHCWLHLAGKKNGTSSQKKVERRESKSFVQADDGSIYESYAVNPAQLIVGLPKPLLKDVQLLNRVFFWKEHEAITEAVKVYCRHNLIQGDFFATRRFLLSLS